MISISQAQVALDAIRAENRLLRRLVERRRQGKQHLPEVEYKGDEQPVPRLPELDKLLAGTEQEVDELFEIYNL